MAYTPYEWLNKWNQVIVKFIEMLIQNNQDSNALSQKKSFKTAVIVDAIYEA